MARKINVPVVTLIFIIICLFCAGLYLFQTYQKECVKNLALQDELEGVKARYSEMEKKLQRTEKLISDLQAKLQDTELQIERLDDELSQKETAHQEALATLGQLKNDLQEQKDLRADLENRLSQAQAGAKKSQEHLIKLDLDKKGLEVRIKELEARFKEVELGTIVVAPEPAPAVPQTQVENKTKAVKSKPVLAVSKVKPFLVNKVEPSGSQPKPGRVLSLPKDKAALGLPEGATESPELDFKGKILTVNKEYNFVVIDLGSQNGVAEGQVFCVYSDSKYIGDIKVEKVHDSLSAACFIALGIKDKVNEGDRITLSK